MSNARNIARLLPNSSGLITSSNIAPNSITASSLVPGKFLKQMKYVRMDTQWTTSTDGDVTAISLTFDSPVAIGNQILVMCSGAIVAGTASNNWGCGGDLWIDSTRLTSAFNDTGTSPQGKYLGVVDLNGFTSGWGSPFNLTAIGNATTTNPLVSFKVNKLTSYGGWSWVGLGYTDTYYGKNPTQLVAFEFGV